MRIVLFLALGAVAACGSSHATGSSEASDAWRARAVASSRFQLADMCGEIAPASAHAPGDPDLAACSLEANAAVNDERETMRADALRQCVRAVSSTDAACCLARTSNASIDAEAQSHCNHVCAGVTGRPPAAGPPAWCHPIAVAPNAPGSSGG